MKLKPLFKVTIDPESKIDDATKKRMERIMEKELRPHLLAAMKRCQPQILAEIIFAKVSK